MKHELAQSMGLSIHLAPNVLVRYSRLSVLVLLLVAALGIRLIHIDEPPLNFHATRQYRSLIIARGFYFDSSISIPDWEKQVAQVSQERQGILEPPIMELLVSIGYRILGGENFWLAHILSSFFWLIGGALLYLIGKRISDADTALFATAFYLFLPFAIVASTTFQPDPLMVMLMLASVFAILRYNDLPSRSRLLIAAVISAWAFVVKPGSVFVILAVFLTLAILKEGIRRAVLSRALLVFSTITFAPTILIYLFGVFSGTLLINEVQKTLLPQLWLSTFFWRSWVANIGSTMGYIPFFAALLGGLMFRPGLPRALMFGLWAGYGIFGLALNYNFATHDYYQLQFIPIVGLSIAPLITLVMNHLHQIYPSWYWRIATWGILGLALILALVDARTRLANPGWEQKVAIEQEIGEQVKHSTRTVYLSSDYGVPLEYHGLLSGAAWPLTSDLEWEQLAGVQSLAPKDRLSAWFNFSPEYFIVEDLDQFAQQPDLQQFLTQNFMVLTQTQDYVIFDLRRK